MEVTDVRLTMLQNAGGVKAIGSFSLDGEFAIRGIRVMEDKNGRNFFSKLWKKGFQELFSFIVPFFDKFYFIFFNPIV